MKISNTARTSASLKLFGSACAAAMLIVPGFALAQSAGAAATVEEVVVTGSSIRGVAPVGSQLLGVTRDTIQANAPANTKELLSSVPQLGNFGANAEQSTANRFRTAGFDPNIHNLGINATLVLVNSHRIAPTGTEEAYADPSMIPVIAIQRVELVADGGSAIYGSDAVAGVVNFIYRKPVDTLEANATYGTGPGRYQKRDFAALYGKTWSGGGAMLAYEYSDNKSPFNTDIPTLALGSNQTSRGGRDLRATNNCYTPTIRAVNGANPPAATGTTYGDKSLGFTTDAVAQRCGILQSTTVIPDGKRNAVLFTANHQVTDALKVWTEINYSYFSTTSIGGPGNMALVVPNTNPYFAGNVPPQLAGAPRVFVNRSYYGIFPEQISHQFAEYKGIALGGDIDFGGDWKGTLMFNLSGTRDFNESPGLDLLNAQAAANGTTVATALNPFDKNGAGTPASVLANINNGFSQNNKAAQRLRSLSFKTDGPLFTLPGGEVRAAFGMEIREDQMKQNQTGGSQAPGSSYWRQIRDDNINRVVTSGFSEFSIPLVSDANAMPLVHSLTLSIAGRADYYALYGTKVNPKYGFNYQPIESVNLHASYGTSFAAPNLGFITSPFSVPQPNTNQSGNTILTGPYKGEKLGTINQLNISNGHVPGTPDLQPENGKTYSIGGEYVPVGNFLEGLRFGATYYHVEYTNTIFKPQIGDILNNPDFAGHFVLHPTQAQVDAALKAYPTQTPVNYPFDLLYDAYAINIGSRVLAGVDLDVSYRYDAGDLGQFTVGLTGNRQMKYDQRLSDNGPYTDQLGTSFGNQAAPRWKTRTSVNWTKDALTLNAFVNYTEGFINTSLTPFQKVKSNTTVDLSGAYTFNSIAKGVTLQVRAQNAFDKQPPFYDAAAGYFPTLASPFGRLVDVTVRAKF